MTSKIFDLFGVESATVGSVARIVAERTGLALSLHDSDARGGEYYRTGVGDRPEIIVQANATDEPDSLAEKGFPSFSVLIYLNYGTLELRDKLSTFEELAVLRNEDL
ncbi:hypothetical protein [Amycolatopsis sp. cmx-4-54]|uniref:hypothetical protein n=1 Tax=Amycolatopsis sp. cmx-4-54 TaxID=2790936 RepID=UPI00397D3701